MHCLEFRLYHFEISDKDHEGGNVLFPFQFIIPTLIESKAKTFATVKPLVVDLNGDTLEIPNAEEVKD